MEDLKEILQQKKIDENAQGTALQMSMPINHQNNNKYFYIESYGCQMNFSDSEIVASILSKEGFGLTNDIFQADIIFINTCSIREKAEQTVRNRLKNFNDLKEQKPDLLIGVLGCMAERLKNKFLEEEHLVDIVVGPDAYRSLPILVKSAEEGNKAVNVLLSREETYADISPVRLDKNGVSGFISIMRGCDNMCSFCVVPFTRGRERSRNPQTIVQEAKDLFNKGYKEVTLLGQNVDSYKWKGEDFIDDKDAPTLTNFAQLLEMVALVNEDLRVRFSTSHPKDITDEVLYTMAKYENICNYIHLPVQSGNTEVLERMNRTYTRDWYLDRVNAIKRIIPDCGISSDVIAGFCGETEAQHQDTLSIMEIVQYDMSYMFFYSERPGTLAARKYEDDVPLDIKKRRLSEIVEIQNKLSLLKNEQDIGKVFKVLVEKTSKKSEDELCGRNSQNKMIVFPKANAKVGDYVNVLVETCTKATLIGKIV
ncbi:MAG: tRNA (N6-isopentenyl adenosine(37)-C2)-methylthiotransferase MiaB [Chitinophagales bacterium]|nr:tRNA (N6-isopentenyl adenosine(37)-C2)-methylthiotransferase MiaB [Chitinophagales bacterium]